MYPVKLNSVPGKKHWGGYDKIVSKILSYSR